MSYVDVGTFRRYVGADVATDDDLLQDCLDEAQKYIETACRRRFEASSDTTRYFDAVRDVGTGDIYQNSGYDRTMLIFDEDICQITSVVNGDGVTVTGSQYVTNPRNVTPYYSISLMWSANVAWTYDTSPENAIAITGRWAFSTTAPNDIQHAVKRLAKWYYNQRDTSGDIDRPMLSTSGAVLLPSSIPKDVADIITRYERRQP